MKKRPISAVTAASVAVSLVMVTASAALAAGVETPAASRKESRYESVDISTITGEIAEPPKLSSAASALAKDKEWYEFVYYSSEPVGYYYLSDNARVSFYDPYDYGSALVMEVDDSLTDWSSSNSLSVSYTTGSSLMRTNGKSTTTDTAVEHAVDDDVSTTEHGKSTVTSTSVGRINTYNASKVPGYTVTNNGWEKNNSTNGYISATIGGDVVGGSATDSVGFEITDSENWSQETHSEVTTEDNGWTQDDTTRTDVTETKDTVVTNQISDRITKTTGVAVNNEISMSTDNSTTITKTYDAGYFNQNGAPLQWKIVRYTVFMPMRYQVEYLIDGEWIFYEDNYCLLKTVQGTCRSWLENNTAYYEHWGTGEPVTWNEFWSSFFTKEQLMQAYQNRLYPNS